MEKENIVYKNRIEVKILLIVYIIILVPVSIALIVTLIKTREFTPAAIFVCLFILLMIIILLIINRFNIVFDYENEIIKYTGYLSKTKKYPFKDINVHLKKSRTTLPYDYDYVFLTSDDKSFKISNINFESETKKSADYLDLLLTGNQKTICSLKKLNIKDGYIGFYTYDLSEQIASVYLSNNFSIKIGYDNNLSCYKLVLLKADNTIVDKNEIYDSNILFNSVQTLIDKYQ